MKRKWIAIILTALLMVCIIAIASLSGKFSSNKENNKVFRFTKDLIDSLYYLQLSESMDNSVDKNLDVTMQAMEGFMKQNTFYESAKRSINKYSNDDNELIQKAAVGIVDSINLFEESNNEKIAMLRNFANGNARDSAHLVAQSKALLQEGIQKIMNYLLPTLKIIVELKEDYNGSLQFKISKQQREQLLEAIDYKFGSYLNLVVVRKEAKAIYFLKGGNFYIGFIKYMKEYLSSDTSEDLSKKGLSENIYFGPAEK